MELLVAYEKDPAGNNMAKYLAKKMRASHDRYLGEKFDLVVIQSPAISADWLEQKYRYDGFVFLSKHAAQSGELALTCHSTGNFSEAHFGGNPRQVAVPHPHLQKAYLQKLWQHKEKFNEFQITIEATHHGPTSLSKPSLFIEIGTTPKQWEDEGLCNSVAELVWQTISEPVKQHPVAICFGGTHYPDKFTKEILHGKYALGTVVPKHALEFINKELFEHIILQNKQAEAAILDWAGLGAHKQKITDLLKTTKLEVIKV